MGHSISEKLTQFKDKFHRAWIRRSELNSLHTTISELRDKKANLKSRITDLESNLEACHSEIICRDAGIADLQSKLDNANADALANRAVIEDHCSSIEALEGQVSSLTSILDEVEAMLDELDVELTANLENEN